MVIYHPAYDVHHCSYRLLHVLSRVDQGRVSRDSLRLIDFYYVYPHLLKRVDLPRALKKYSASISAVAEPFEITPNPRGLFFDLARIQDSALVALEQKSILSTSVSSVALRAESIPVSLKEHFELDDFSQSDFFKALVGVFPTLKLDGANGFKSRSGLMEYRYG